MLARKPRKDQQESGAFGAHLPTLSTVPEVAELLRTTTPAIYKMVERNKLPGVVRIGSRVLFDTAELLRWLRM